MWLEQKRKTGQRNPLNFEKLWKTVTENGISYLWRCWWIWSPNLPRRIYAITEAEVSYTKILTMHSNFLNFSIMWEIFIINIFRFKCGLVYVRWSKKKKRHFGAFPSHSQALLQNTIIRLGIVFNKVNVPSVESTIHKLAIVKILQKVELAEVFSTDRCCSFF